MHAEELLRVRVEHELLDRGVCHELLRELNDALAPRPLVDLESRDARLERAMAAPKQLGEERSTHGALALLHRPFRPPCLPVREVRETRPSFRSRRAARAGTRLRGPA